MTNVNLHPASGWHQKRVRTRRWAWSPEFDGGRCPPYTAFSTEDALERLSHLFRRQLANGCACVLVEKPAPEREAVLQLISKRELRSAQPPRTGCGLLPLQRPDGFA